MLYSILHNPFAEIVFWLLVHSLWQAGVLAGLLSIPRRRWTPRTRYAIALAAVAIFLAAQGVTLASLIRSRLDQPVFQQAVSAFDQKQVDRLIQDRLQENGLLYVDAADSSITFHNVLKQIAWYGTWILIAWVCVALFQLVRLLAALYLMRRLTHTQRPVSAELRDTFDSLRKRLGVRARVRFLEGDLIPVAMTFGWLKPVVLVNKDFAAAVDGPRLNAVVLHELAHIQRADFLNALLLKAAGVVYRLNPFFRRLQAQVNADQEACCDQRAAAVVQSLGMSAEEYAELLVDCARRQRESLALRFAPVDGSLKSRVLQVLAHRNALDRSTSWPMLAGVIAVIAVALAVIGTPVSRVVELDDRLRWLSTRSFQTAMLQIFDLDRPNPDAIDAIAGAAQAWSECGMDERVLEADPRLHRMIEVLAKGASLDPMHRFVERHADTDEMYWTKEPDWPAAPARAERPLTFQLLAMLKTAPPERRQDIARAALVLGALGNPTMDGVFDARLLREPTWVLEIRPTIDQIETATLADGLRGYRMKKTGKLSLMVQEETPASTLQRTLDAAVEECRFSMSSQSWLADLIRRNNLKLTPRDQARLAPADGPIETDGWYMLRRRLAHPVDRQKRLPSGRAGGSAGG